MATPDSPPEPLVKSYQDLLALLDSDGVPYQADPTAQEAIIQTQKGDMTGVLAMRWQDHEGVLQFIQPLPLEFPAERLPMMESAVCRLNAALVIAGFELSYVARQVAFRTTLPVLPRGGLLPAEIQIYFRLTVKTAADYLAALRRIASGESAPESILTDAQLDRSATPLPDNLKTYTH